MLRSLAALVAAALPLLAQAQTPPGWQACAALGAASERLACFDHWTESQGSVPQAAPPPASILAPAAPASTAADPEAEAAAVASAIAAATPGGFYGFRLTPEDGCRNERYSELSRFWELEPGASCGTFGIRGFRPMSLDLVTADTVNRLPTSENPANNAAESRDFRTKELRLQLSVRTKIAQGLLVGDSKERDSLWFAYSQQSYWQLFTPGLSRPFRSTDHEPEVIYVAPLQSADPSRWRLRYGGLGLVHQSNGQSLPLSRSWNRAYLMAGAERGALQLQARIWHRLPEGGDDDNPGISDYIGRGELRATWRQNRANLWSVAARHSLRADTRGALRLEWFHSLWDDGKGPAGGLQLHTQLFTGYGDTLLDYNRKRTVFSIGLSLVEW